MANITLTSTEIMQLDSNFDSALIKLLYSFLWQEWAIVDGGEDSIWLQPETNERGTELMPTVNAFANILNNFPEYDQDLQVFQQSKTWINVHIHNLPDF